MSKFIYFTPEEKARAQNTDLVSLLRAQGERPIRSGREYRTPNDPSVTVRGNKWFDHSARVGGYAVSFVQRYYRLSYQEAVLLLLGRKDGKRYEQAHPAPTEPKPFALPDPYDNMRRVYAYLMRQRHIDRDVITGFVREKLLYEDVHHNCVFVGLDDSGEAKHAHIRSTNSQGKTFRIRQRKNKNMEGISMRTIVRNTALTLVAFALALILPNTASAACEGFTDVPEDAACYESVMYLAEHGITKGTEANTFSPAQSVTVRQWAVMLCRAYGMETSGETWAELGRSATEQACQKGWLNMTALSSEDTRMCRGALYESALAASGVSVYDSVLYEGGTNLSAYDNYLRVGCELQLCPADATASEIVTRGEAVQLLYAILTQSFAVEAPPAPVTLENPTGVHTNDFLLELRRVPESILAAFNEAGWTYRIDFDFMADLSDRLDMSCIGATSYGKKIIYVSDAKATIHEFGHFLDGALGFPTEHERLYLAEAQDSGLRDYAKTNSREYFADCFVYWITYSGNEKRMEAFRNAAPKTYTYMEKLATNNWVF